MSGPFTIPRALQQLRQHHTGPNNEVSAPPESAIYSRTHVAHAMGFEDYEGTSTTSVTSLSNSNVWESGRFKTGKKDDDPISSGADHSIASNMTYVFESRHSHQESGGMSDTHHNNRTQHSSGFGRGGRNKLVRFESDTDTSIASNMTFQFDSTGPITSSCQLSSEFELPPTSEHEPAVFESPFLSSRMSHPSSSDFESTLQEPRSEASSGFTAVQEESDAETDTDVDDEARREQLFHAAAQRLTRQHQHAAPLPPSCSPRTERQKKAAALLPSRASTGSGSGSNSQFGFDMSGGVERGKPNYGKPHRQKKKGVGTGDMWIESVSVFQGVSKRGQPQIFVRHYFQNAVTGEKKWDKPPPSATNIVYATEQDKIYAQEKKKKFQRKLGISHPDAEQDEYDPAEEKKNKKAEKSLIKRMFPFLKKKQKALPDSQDFNLQRALQESMKDQERAADKAKKKEEGKEPTKHVAEESSQAWALPQTFKQEPMASRGRERRNQAAAEDELVQRAMRESRLQAQRDQARLLVARQ